MSQDKTLSPTPPAPKREPMSLKIKLLVGVLIVIIAIAIFLPLIGKLTGTSYDRNLSFVPTAVTQCKDGETGFCVTADGKQTFAVDSKSQEDAIKTLGLLAVGISSKQVVRCDASDKQVRTCRLSVQANAPVR